MYIFDDDHGADAFEYATELAGRIKLRSVVSDKHFEPVLRWLDGRYLLDKHDFSDIVDGLWEMYKYGRQDGAIDAKGDCTMRGKHVRQLFWFDPDEYPDEPPMGGCYTEYECSHCHEKSMYKGEDGPFFCPSCGCRVTSLDSDGVTYTHLEAADSKIVIAKG